MSLINEAPVFQLTYELLKEIHIAKQKNIKSEKYTLGERLEQSVLDILLNIIDAGRMKHEWKITAIKNALLNLEKAKILIRLASYLGQINERGYIAIQEILQKIGRMLGGWRRSI